MKYELAKQLNEAGFPQEGNGEFIRDRGFVTGEDNPVLYHPTLSELIEECGEGFRQLVRHSEYNKNRESMGLSKLGRVWTAKAGYWAGGFITRGFTPEEAVAKLWLKLKQTPKE